LALVTAAEDGDASAASLEGAREFFDDGSLAGSANCQISDADNKTAQGALAKESFAVKIEAQLNDPLVNERQGVENRAQNGRAKPTPAAEHHVDTELFEIFERPAHIISDD
jgi:hypothetical protein